MPVRLVPRALLALLVLLVAREAAGAEGPHHSHGHGRANSQAKAGRHEHRRGELPKVLAEARGAAMLEQGDPPEGGNESTPKKAMCVSNSELLQQVVGKNRRSFFKEGEATHDRIFGLPSGLPRGCINWINQKQCCTRTWYKRLSEATERTAEEFGYVRDQYFNFKQDNIDQALQAPGVEKESPEAERLLAAADAAKQGIANVLEFIDNCEDPLRLFFASTACSLCAPNLDENLTEGQTLHVSQESCAALTRNCSQMPDKLKDAGMSFIKARDLLADNASEELWYQRSQTWLDRAAKLTLLRSKEIRPKYHVNSTFCKALANEGYVYRPDNWGDVMLLHISFLATEEEKEAFIPQDEMRFFVPQEGRLAFLRAKAETIEAELGLESGAAESESEAGEKDDAGDKDDAPKHASLSQLSAKKEVRRIVTAEPDEGDDLACVHGQKLRYHCQCAPCWTGVKCDKAMNQGPDVKQEFEPLVAQAAAGAQQELAVQGCDLHVDLRFQLARITLVPIKEAAEDRRPAQDLCKQPQGGYTNALRMRIPELVSQKEYLYLIDLPIGAVPKYEVCYCYGVACMDSRLEWNTVDSLKGWSSIGQVQVVSTHEQRDAIVQKMFEPAELLARRKREMPSKLCSTDWYIRDNDTFMFTRKGQTVTFKCHDGYANLKGAIELLCDDGAWKVAKHSEDNPLEAKLSPPDMAPWEEGQFPECSWKLADNCSVDEASQVVSKASPPVTNIFSGDGQVHYRCNPHADGSPMRLALKSPDHRMVPGEEVVVNRSDIGHVHSYNDGQYEVKLLTTGEVLHAAPENIEWLLQDTSFVRRCGPKGSYEPESVEIRCLLVMPGATDQEGPDDTDATGQAADEAAEALQTEKTEKAKEVEEANEATETTETETEATEENETAPASLLERGSSLLEASATATVRGSVRAQAISAEAADSTPVLRLQPWPLLLSQDTERVFHVDSCWLSSLNCTDGSPAKDTARALQKMPVPQRTLQHEEAAQRHWGLAGPVCTLPPKTKTSCGSEM